MQGRERMCPCKGCEKRGAVCRITCEAWREWEEEHKIWRDADRKRRERENGLDYYNATCERRRRKKWKK